MWPEPDVSGALAFALGALAVAAVFSLIAYVALRWITVLLAQKVAIAAERRLAAVVHKGLGRLPARRPGAPTHEARRQREKALNQIAGIARLMDRAIPLPIIGGIGLDAILGVIPVAGDVAGLAANAFIIVRAVQLGVPADTVSRLIAIACLDVVLGAVPVIGDLADVAYQANSRSAALIRQVLADAEST